MKLQLKKIMAFCFAFGLCFHFFCITIYSSPYTHLPNKLTTISDMYVYPYFQQHWGLFVPTPKKEYHLYTRFQYANTWSNWEDTFLTQQMKHRCNLALGNETLVLLYSSILNYAYYSINTKNMIFKKAPNNIEFDILKHAVKQQFSINNQPFQQFEIIISATENKHSKSYYFKNLQ